MLISFIKKGVYGYLRDDGSGIHGFFSNNNLSFRKSAIVDAGGYDPEIRIAEDYDACQRVSAAGWLLYYCPEISIDHRARDTLRGLLRQWWNYGYHLAGGYKRHYPRQRTIAWTTPDWDDQSAPEPLRRKVQQGTEEHRRSFAVYLYLSAFALFNLSTLAAVTAGFFSMGVASQLLSALSLIILLVYAYPDFSRLNTDGLLRALQLFFIRYCVNLVFLSGGFLGGLRNGALYFFPPIKLRVAPPDT